MSSLVAGATPSSPSGDSWPGGGSTVTGPIASDMPHRPTICRAMLHNSLRIALAPPADHLPGDVPDRVEISLRPGGHVAVDALLGGAAAERADDPAAQVPRG